MKFSKLLTNIDMFGLTILPNLKGKTTAGTKVGGTLTILFYIGMLAYTGVLIKNLA